MREFGSEHPAIVLPDGYFKTFEQYGLDVTYLRCGREALLLAAITCKMHFPESDYVALLPAYCCWSMSAPFLKAGWRIVYYRLNEDLTIDIDYLLHLVDTERPQAILTMNYFGSAPTNEAVAAVKDISGEIIVIEDFSHCTFSFDNIFNPQVDIYVSSIRKSIGVSDGAIILSKIQLKKELIQKDTSDFCIIRYRAQREKKLYEWTHNQLKNSEFRRELGGAASLIEEIETVNSISDLSALMLNQVNGQMVAYARRENMRHLIGLLQGKVRLIPNIERSLSGAPFSCPILVEDRDEMQIRLSNNGLYAPVLWPIDVEAEKVCSISNMMSKKMLSIPIDQRYDWNDIEQISEILIDVLN